MTKCSIGRLSIDTIHHTYAYVLSVCVFIWIVAHMCHLLFQKKKEGERKENPVKLKRETSSLANKSTFFFLLSSFCTFIIQQVSLYFFCATDTKCYVSHVWAMYEFMKIVALEWIKLELLGFWQLFSLIEFSISQSRDIFFAGKFMQSQRLLCSSKHANKFSRDKIYP